MPRILIVEDRAPDRKFLSVLLSSAGYEVHAAVDGADALEEVSRRPPDLVISDILMPSVDGYQFVVRMRQLDGLAATPVIFYTATYHEAEARHLAARCGVADVLVKPSPGATILARVADVLQRPVDPTAPAPDTESFAEDHYRIVSAALVEKAGDLDASRHRLAALIELGARLADERNPPALVRTACATARDVTLAQHAVVGLLTEDQTAISGMTAVGLDADQRATLSWPSLEGGVIRDLVGGRRIVRCRNPGGEPTALGLPADHPPVHSYLGVPIASGTRLFGWIGLRNKLGADQFTDIDEQVAATIGIQAGIAYENARLYADLLKRTMDLEGEVAERQRSEERLRRRARLVKFQADVNFALTLDVPVREMLDRCASALVEHLDAAFGRIWVLDPVRAELTLQASAGQYTRLDGEFSRIKVGDSKVGMIAADRQPVLSNDVVQESFIRHPEWARREGLTSFAGYPLVVEDRVVGVMAMFARVPIGETGIGALAAVASAVAVGIERKRIEERLKASEERMRYGLAAVRAGTWEVDLTSGRLHWSESTAQVFGRAEGDGVTTLTELFDTVVPDDRPKVIEAFDAAIAGTGEFSVEFRAIAADGSEHWIDGRARILFDEHRKPLRALGIAINIAERKLLEEQLRLSQKLEVVGQLAGGLAHDFNNLLTTVIGYANLVSSTLDAADPRQADLAEIRGAAERAAGLTQQLLATSRRQVVQPVLLDVNEMLSETGKMLARLIGEHIELRMTLDAPRALVRMDPGQLEQIVMNLAVNARDAMPEGGQLELGTSVVDLDDTLATSDGGIAPGPHVQITVRDTGLGMDDHTKAHLFEPFFTTKDRGKGTGLGLATVYGIVRQNQGSIHVTSASGRGTTIEICLPLEPEGSAVAAARTDEVVRGGTESILVVEDERAVRYLMRTALTRAGFAVVDAASPAEAERVVASGLAIDAVVTDVLMPGMKGPELFRRIQAARPGLRVLYVSGYADEEVTGEALREDKAAFLAKPFAADDLVRKVREVLDR
jgi:PAS domain S-box-containing protein